VRRPERGAAVKKRLRRIAVAVTFAVALGWAARVAAAIVLAVRGGRLLDGEEPR
jgi:hypothetical protein